MNLAIEFIEFDMNMYEIPLYFLPLYCMLFFRLLADLTMSLNV